MYKCLVNTKHGQERQQKLMSNQYNNNNREPGLSSNDDPGFPDRLVNTKQSTEADKIDIQEEDGKKYILKYLKEHNPSYAHRAYISKLYPELVDIIYDEEQNMFKSPYIEGERPTKEEVEKLRQLFNTTSRGFIRDVNPENIIMTEEGPILIDFDVDTTHPDWKRLVNTKQASQQKHHIIPNRINMDKEYIKQAIFNMMNKTAQFNQNKNSFDYWIQRDYSRMLDILKLRLPNIFNMQGRSRDIELRDVDIKLPKKYPDLREQLKAKDSNKDYTIPIKGTFVLKDKSGKQLARKKKLIMRLPFPTGRGTYIVGGKEYAIRRQLRLLPGVYTTSVDDGIQSFINTGTRQNIKLHFSPDTMKFKLNMGGRTFNLYPVLRAFGIDDDTLRRGWGEQIYQRNAIHSDDRMHKTIDRLYDTVHRYGEKNLTFDQKVDKIKEAFAETELDPWTTRVTLDQEHHHVSPGMLLDTTGKMLGVSSGEREPDKRDALYFKTIFGVEDAVDFALDRYEKKIRRKLQSRLNDTNKDLNSVVSRPISSTAAAVRGRFNVSDLSFTPDQLNPIEMLSNLNEVTLMGEGGISDVHTIPESSRALDDSFMGYIDPAQTPTSAKIGVNMHTTYATRKVGSNLATTVYDVNEMKKKSFTPQELYDKYVALPQEYKSTRQGAAPKRKKVQALHKGEIVTVPSSKIDYALPHGYAAFGYATNMIPFVNHNAGPRVTFAAKQMGHAIPLKDGEVPLVRNVFRYARNTREPLTASQALYRKTNVRVPEDVSGKVVKVTKDQIWIKPRKGKTVKIDYYNDFPLNSHIAWNTNPVVEVGDKVKPGQVVAANQFSKDGELALGKNLRIAYMPYKGLNFQDGLVISEDAAKKMTSQHQYQDEYTVNKGDVLNKKKFVSHYPQLYTRSQLERLDEDGIVKPGTVVEEGDPLMLKMSQRQLTEDDILRGKVSSIFKSPLARDDKSWDHEIRGKVVKVVKNDKFIKVYVQTEEPAKRGDKLSGWHGQKGVISAVLPADEMPRDEEGNVIDIVQNPAAVPSRMNVGQVLETMAAKIAKKTGKPYDVHNFEDDIGPRKLAEQLKEHGLSDTETLYDADGNPIGDVFTGYQYFLKLRQQASKYAQSRSREDTYDIISHRPIKGPKMGPLGFFALLAHGATDNLKEMGSGFKSEMNDDWWRAFESGLPTPKPKTTFAFEKLKAFLRGAGMDFKSDGDSIRLLPMSDEAVDNFSKGEIKDPGLAIKIGKPGTADFLSPIPGGLYDRKTTGGQMGDKWAHITLAEPLPNPLFEKPIRTLLDLKVSEYEDIIKGKKGVTGAGAIEPVTPENQSRLLVGGKAITKLLSGISRDKMLKENLEIAKTARGANKDTAIKKTKYLNALKIAGMKPTDYVISKIPVIPPVFRPVYLTQRGDLRVSDITNLYQNLGRVNNTMKEMGQNIPAEVTSTLRGDLYDAVKALQGLGNAKNYQGGREARGILKFLKGDIPARGHFQDKIFSKRQVLGGRAVIMGNPDLEVDEVGIPDEMAWDIYKPFVMRRLSQQGVLPLDAKLMIKDKNPAAQRALDREMSQRPVILSRDPKLHKFNYLAFRPHRIPGSAIHIPPLVTKGFNADFDGDAMAVNVPVTEEARKEALSRMMPSQNLLKYGKDTVIMFPEEDAIAGLYAGTKMKKKGQRKFKNNAELLKAYSNGDIALTEGAHAGNTYTTPGRILFNEYLPEDLRNYERTWSAGDIKEMLNQVARKHPKDYVNVVQGIKDLGDEYSYNLALTFNLKDFFPVSNRSTLAQLRKQKQPGVSDKLQEQIDKKLRDRAEDSIMGVMADSGAKGGWNNIQQILYSPLYVSDITGKRIDRPIESGYAEGMGFEDYWTAAKGARSALQASALEVSEPGFFGKQLQRATMGMTVQPGEGSVTRGLKYPVTHPTVLHRYLAADVRAPSGRILAKANTPVTSELIEAAQKAGIEELSVRSPLTSTANEGLYAKDFGRLPEGDKPEPGTDIGIISSHTLSEPAVQLTLRSFHGGGAASQAGKVKGMYAIWPILNGRPPAGAKAVMAYRPGKITEVNKLKSGAHEIKTDRGDVYTTTPGLDLFVKKGDQLKTGQQLQDGYLDPKEVLKYRGLRPLQMYLVDQIEDNYGDYAPDRRYLEALVAALTRYAKIQNPGDSSDFLPGDIVPVNRVKEYNQQNDANVTFQPLFTGMAQWAPKAEPDWVAKMMGRDMIRQLQESAATGAESRLRGPNPVMPFIYNKTFADYIDLGDY